MRPVEEKGSKYVLIIKEGISFIHIYIYFYNRLCSCNNADSDDATTAFGKWIVSFAGMDWLAADQGSHFNSSLMKNLTDHIHIIHHFTTAYFCWSTGTAERECRDVIRILRALLWELRMSIGQCPAELDNIQRIMNHFPVGWLGKNEKRNARFQMEVFLDLRSLSLSAWPTPLRWYRDLEKINAKRCG